MPCRRGRRDRTDHARGRARFQASRRRWSGFSASSGCRWRGLPVARIGLEAGSLSPSGACWRPLLRRRIDRAAINGLDRGDDGRLANSTPAALAARALTAQIGVVDLDPARELGLLRLARRHRGHQLVLHQPGGGLLDPKPAPELDRAHPALALGQVVNRRKPDGQRQLGVLKHRAGGQPHLPLAAVARADRPALQLGAAPVAAGRADPALAPAQLEQRRPAWRLGPEPLPELGLANPFNERRNPVADAIPYPRPTRKPRKP